MRLTRVFLSNYLPPKKQSVFLYIITPMVSA